jgi:hypothetical protein
MIRLASGRWLESLTKTPTISNTDAPKTAKIVTAGMVIAW